MSWSSKSVERKPRNNSLKTSLLLRLNRCCIYLESQLKRLTFSFRASTISALSANGFLNSKLQMIGQNADCFSFKIHYCSFAAWWQKLRISKSCASSFDRSADQKWPVRKANNSSFESLKRQLSNDVWFVTERVMCKAGELIEADDDLGDPFLESTAL